VKIGGDFRHHLVLEPPSFERHNMSVPKYCVRCSDDGVLSFTNLAQFVSPLPPPSSE